MALPSRPGDGAGRSRAPRVLVIALVVQLVLAGVAIFFAVNGWPWVGGGPAPTAKPLGAQPVARSADADPVTVPSRFQAGAEGDGVPTPRVDRFDSDAAFALLRRQVDRYGWRPAGSSSLRRLANDLRARLPRGALEPVSGHPGLQNVVGRIPGAQPAIVLGAHYDVEARPRGFVGANDGAAGTAAVVEIARALARRPVPRGAREIRIALFDGEEEPVGSTDFARDALRGSKDYVRRHGDRVGSMVLLDYIANRGLRLPRESTSDSDLWSRMRSAAGRVGVARSFPAGTQGAIFDDHTPFLDAGVPAIDLIDFVYPWRDGLEDTVDKVTPRSLDVVGEATIEMLLRERLRGVADPRTYTGSR